MAEYIYGSDNNENNNENGYGGETQEQGGDRPAENQNVGVPGGYYGGYPYAPNGYGYGYQYGPQYTRPMPPAPPTPPTPPKKSGGRTAIIVLTIVLATVLLATAAGVGGYFWTRGITPSSPVETGGFPSDKDSETEGEPAVSNPSTGVVLTPGSQGTKDKGTIAEVVKKTADSVVEITTEYAQQNGLYYTYGAGSGVIIDEGGYIITNNHVISGDSGTATKIRVRLTDGKAYDAKIIGADSDSDIAVLKIDATGLTKAEIGMSSTLVVGEEVVIIGNPLGTLGGSVTNGIISALDREITVEDETMNLLQTNAAVNPGNSGGGMFNMAGELIGIVNAKYSEAGIEGLGFAIPIDDAITVANELLEYGYVRGRVSLHITVTAVTTVEQMMRLRVNTLGLYVIEAESGYNDALKSMDRIAQVDGIEITDMADLKAVLKRHSVGDKLEAVVMRNGTAVNVVLECFEKTTGDVQFGGTGENG